MTMGYSVPTSCKKVDLHHRQEACPQLPGTILRIFIPAGAVINLLNLIELASPSGICLIIRLPFLGGNSSLDGLFESIKRAGGTVEVM